MHPYTDLEEYAFWKLAVAEKNFFDISGIWSPKFEFSKKQRFVTFGSCFAQHIGSSLKKNGYKWLNAELPPSGLSAENCRRFSYGVFSARTGNIYTASLLNQWTRWALGGEGVPTEELWCKDGYYYDPFRPNIEPGGFYSKQELLLSRQYAIKCFRSCIEQADYFVYTFGLTEGWLNSVFAYEYPVCPGVVAGEYDADHHQFVNHQFLDIFNSMMDIMNMMRDLNPRLKFILTVSPVPLVATNSGQHVLVATSASKSILRSVAGQLAMDLDYVDYFPSYEIINSPVYKGVFFEQNQRSVSSFGVDFVMQHFFQCIDAAFADSCVSRVQNRSEELCDEELLESFIPL